MCPLAQVKESNSEEQHPGSSCVKVLTANTEIFLYPYGNCAAKCPCRMSQTELHNDLSIRQTPKSTLIQVMIHPLFIIQGNARTHPPAPFSVNVCLQRRMEISIIGRSEKQGRQTSPQSGACLTKPHAERRLTSQGPFLP